MSPLRFRTVSFDADSTLSGIEGIDWLAALRGPELAALSAQLTADAMEGRTTIEAVYGKRLALVAPTAAEIQALADAYVREIAPGAATCLTALSRAGVRVLIVSGGLRQALEPLAHELGVPDADLHAVRVEFADDTTYRGYDAASPLTTSQGKAALLKSLDVPGPLLHVGDGSTDAVTAGVVDGFMAYTGFVRRDSAVSKADFVAGSFEEVARWVVGTPGA